MCLCHDSMCQCVQVAVLLFCWGVFVMFTLLLSHYPRCSGQYWAIFAVQAGACIGAESLFIFLVGCRSPTLRQHGHMS